MRSQSLLFRSAVWFQENPTAYDYREELGRNPFYSGLLFDSTKEKLWKSKKEYLVAIPSIQVCCLIHWIDCFWYENERVVAIPSIQVCCLIRPFVISKYWRGNVAIPSIQVCCLIRTDAVIRMLEKNAESQSLLFRSAVWFSDCKVERGNKWSRNPFYSGLLFDSKNKMQCTKQSLSRNPFYSGLLFDSVLLNQKPPCNRIESQSLLFRSAVWFREKSATIKSISNMVAIPSIQVCCLIRQNKWQTGGREKVAIPSIQVCCLIQSRENDERSDEIMGSQSLLFRSAVWFSVLNASNGFYVDVSRNPFYSGLLFDS